MYVSPFYVNALEGVLNPPKSTRRFKNHNHQEEQKVKAKLKKKKRSMRKQSRRKNR